MRDIQNSIVQVHSMWYKCMSGFSLINTYYIGIPPSKFNIFNINKLIYLQHQWICLTASSE